MYTDNAHKPDDIIHVCRQRPQASRHAPQTFAHIGTGHTDAHAHSHTQSVCMHLIHKQRCLCKADAFAVKPTHTWTGISRENWECTLLTDACLFFQGALRPRQNGRHFADDTFKHIFLNENVRISIKISLKFVPKVPIDNIPALVQIMAWRRPGDKPLSEPIMVSLLTHICVTRPQWVKKDHHRGLGHG